MKQTILLLLITTLAFYANSQNRLVSTGVIFDGEPYIVVNPSNPHHMVVAWMGLPLGQTVTIRTRVTFDAGSTWSPVVALPHAEQGFGSADPSLAFDTEGNVVACYIDYKNDPVAGGVYFVKSSNSGLTWGSMVKAIDAFDDDLEYPIDRPWFSVNPVTNHYYVTSMSANWGPVPNHAYFASSADGGQTWSALRRLDDTGFLVGNSIAKPMPVNAVSADGIFHAIYPSWLPAQSLLPAMIHAQSTDHGVTFSYNTALSSNAAGGNDQNAKNGYRLTTNPANPLHLALVGIYTLSGDQDVYLSESYDGGLTWSALQRVNDDLPGNGRMQDLVWADFDDDGDLAFTWRDRRNAPDSGYSTSQEIYGAVKWNGQNSVSPNFPISSAVAPWNSTLLDQNGNDFMCVVMRDDTLNTVWGDVRNNKLEIWFQRTDAQSGQPVSISRIADEEMSLIRIFPVPAGNTLQWEGASARWCEIRFEDGRIVRKIERPQERIDISDLAPGAYFITFGTPGGSQTLRFVHL